MTQCLQWKCSPWKLSKSRIKQPDLCSQSPSLLLRELSLLTQSRRPTKGCQTRQDLCQQQPAALLTLFSGQVAL